MYLLIVALLGCPAVEVEPEPVDVEVSVNENVHTVLDVSLESESETRARVHFGLPGAMDKVTSWSALGTTHDLTVVGVPADTLVELQVELESGETSEVLTETTGSLPAGLPEMTIEGSQEALTGQYLIIGIGGSRYGVLIYNAKGQIVWYKILSRTVPRSRLVQDGRLIITASGPEDTGPGSLTAYSLGGELLEELDTPHVHHDFIELEDGTLAAIFARQVDDLGKADGILEVAPDGTVTEIWSAWDEWGSAEGADFLDPTFQDWTHANSLIYDETTGQYLLSLRSLGSIVAIDRATGELQWKAFGHTSDFDPVVGYNATDHHGMQLLDDGDLLLFDNGSLDRRGYSRVASYDIDVEANTITETWNYTHEPLIECYILGDVMRFDTGETLIVWSTAGELEMIDQDDQTIWTANVDLGTVFTYLSVVDTLYPQQESR